MFVDFIFLINHLQGSLVVPDELFVQGFFHSLFNASGKFFLIQKILKRNIKRLSNDSLGFAEWLARQV